MADSLRFEDVQVRFPDLRVWRGDREIYLSMMQLRLLLILMSSPYECFTHEELVQRMDLAGVEGLPQVALWLRRKLGGHYVLSVRGMGYAFSDRRD